MDIHEYQAKEILSRFGVAIPRGGLAYSPEQAAYRAREIGGTRWVVKGQIHSGGRGKAGGIELCDSEQQVYDFADKLFGKRLVTAQTGAAGKTVYRVYVEAASSVVRVPAESPTRSCCRRRCAMMRKSSSPVACP